jgi:hypothetical protein
MKNSRFTALIAVLYVPAAAPLSTKYPMIKTTTKKFNGLATSS